MIKIMIIFFVIAFSLDTYPRSGDHVKNGGGLSESNFAFSRLNLKMIIDSCLTSPLCITLKKEKVLAKAVAKVIDQELKVIDQIEYVSEKLYPGFFYLDGNVRVAKTGSSIGDKIYINRDLIYDADGQALDYSQTTAIIFHELGHHTGFHNHDFLDLVGAKIGLFVARKSSSIGTLYGDVSLPITKIKLIEVKVITSIPGKELLVIATKDQLIDITGKVQQAVELRVEKRCQTENIVCKMFLGVTEEGKYSAKVLYFQNAKFKRLRDPIIDKKHTWYDVELTGFSYHDSLKVSSQFYHLPHYIKIRVKLDNINHFVFDVSLLGISSDTFFGFEL